MVSKETVRRVGIERRQSKIEAEPRRAVGTQDRVRLAHIDVDVRVVSALLWCEGAEELADAGAYESMSLGMALRHFSYQRFS
jgi:hypothetical protein